MDAAVREQHELELLRSRRICVHDLDFAVSTHSFVSGHVECVTNLMGHQQRSDLLEIPQLDDLVVYRHGDERVQARSEEHTSELQSQSNLVCRLLLEKKKKIKTQIHNESIINQHITYIILTLL